MPIRRAKGRSEERELSDVFLATDLQEHGFFCPFYSQWTTPSICLARHLAIYEKERGLKRKYKKCQKCPILNKAMAKIAPEGQPRKRKAKVLISQKQLKTQTRGVYQVTDHIKVEP